MDHWDPALTDGLAANRPVILLDNTGVAGSSGQTPDTVGAQADNAAAFIHALGLTHVDVLGFSIGGYVAQALALRHPELVRRLVLVGTKPRAGDDRDRHPDVNYVATRNEVLSLEDFRFLFFVPSQTSQAAGERFWERAAINGRCTWIRPHPSSRCRPGQPRSSTGSSHMVSRSRN